MRQSRVSSRLLANGAAASAARRRDGGGGGGREAATEKTVAAARAASTAHAVIAAATAAVVFAAATAEAAAAGGAGIEAAAAAAVTAAAAASLDGANATTASFPLVLRCASASLRPSLNLQGGFRRFFYVVTRKIVKRPRRIPARFYVHLQRRDPGTDVNAEVLKAACIHRDLRASPRALPKKAVWASPKAAATTAS